MKKSEKTKKEKKENAVARKRRKSRFTVFLFVAQEGRKVGLLKRRAPFWCEAHFQVKSVKN